MHWWQNTYIDRFQEYAPEWLNYVNTTSLIPLNNIKKVPIVFFADKKDDVCSYERAIEL